MARETPARRAISMLVTGRVGEQIAAIVIRVNVVVAAYAVKSHITHSVRCLAILRSDSPRPNSNAGIRIRRKIFLGILYYYCANAQAPNRLTPAVL